MKEYNQIPETVSSAVILNTSYDDALGSIKGHVKLELLNSSGEVIWSDSGNAITYTGRHRMARSICGDTGISATEKVINTLKCAGGAVTGGDHMNPTAVAITDTGMFEPSAGNIYSTAISGTAFSTLSATVAPIVTFTHTLTAASVNRIINEAGLFFGTTGPIFSHYSFASVDMRNTTSNSLVVTWALSF